MHNRLKELRLAQGIELEKLANLVGIPCDELQKMESGKEVVVNTRAIAKLANTLKVKPSEIFPE